MVLCISCYRLVFRTEDSYPIPPTGTQPSLPPYRHELYGDQSIDSAQYISTYVVEPRHHPARHGLLSSRLTDDVISRNTTPISCWPLGMVWRSIPAEDRLQPTMVPLISPFLLISPERGKYMHEHKHLRQPCCPVRLTAFSKTSFMLQI